MCYAPFDDPEIAVAIVVERGLSGANLSRMARNVLDAISASAASATRPSGRTAC